MVFPGTHRGRGRASTCLLVLAVVVAVLSVHLVVNNSAAFLSQGSLEATQRAAAAASLAAALSMAAPVLPALAEEPDVKSLEAQERVGIERLQKEKAKPQMATAQLEKLEKEELEVARKAETLRLKQLQLEERRAKDLANEQEKKEKAAIEKEEAQAKLQINKDLKAEREKIDATEREEIKLARDTERAEKKAAIDAKKLELAAAGKDSAKRGEAAEKAEAAIVAAAEKAEAAIIAAKEKSEIATKLALERAEDARVAAVERAEKAEKAVTERAELARDQAVEKAEEAELNVVQEEEKVERTVVEAVEEIEKEELVEENQALTKTKAILSSVGSVLAPVAIPGLLMMAYAFIASLFSPPPIPAKGGESEETRRKLGRRPRQKLASATIDPWEVETKDAPWAESVTSKTGTMAGAALVALVTFLPSAQGFVAPTNPTKARPAVASAPVAQVPRQVQGSAGQGLATATCVAAAGAVAIATLRKSGAKLAGSRKSQRSMVVSMQAVPNEISEENPLRIVVAGGGVGGLLLGKALSKVPQFQVTLLEQTNQFARFGGPIQLASNALSLIRDVDEEVFERLMEKFTFTGNRKNGLVDALRTEWYCPFDAMKGAADFFSLPYTGVVDRPDLQELLLSSLPKGVLLNGKKVDSYQVLPDNQGVKVKTVDGSEVEADVLVGADGIWSAVRAQMWNQDKKGPGSECTYSGYIVFAGETVYSPEDYFDVGYKVYMGPKRYFVTSDVGRGRVQWYAFVSVPEGQGIPEEDAAKKDYLKGCFQGWSEQIQDLIDATPAQVIEDRALYDRPPSVLKSWASGPVCLMGDACHPMMPNLGQGGCQAMEDGYAIWSRLKQAKNRSEIPDMLQDYYRSRIVRASIVQGLSRIASDLLLSTFTFPWKDSEGLAAPYGPGKGDFNYEAVVVNYLRYLLPGIFTLQFGYLYSFHPHRWTADEVKDIVKKVMDRHKEDAHAAWEQREEAVKNGTADQIDSSKGSFFKLVAQTT